MFRSPILVLSCAAALLSACSSDGIIGPRGHSGNTQIPSGSMQQLVGVLEMMDETHFGLRQPDRLVPLLCSSELESELGKEIRVWGKFNQEGVFAVANYDVPGEDADEPALLRVPLVRSKLMPRSGRLR
jgi:hypothetical protein